MPPPSRSLIHLISASWLVQSPPPFSAGSSSVRLVLLAAPYSGAVVSPVESDCAGGREVNWKKLRCSHRGAEARGNKLDISPIHVGWRVYTIYPPPPPHTATTHNSHIHTHTFLRFGQRLTGETESRWGTIKHYHTFVQTQICMCGYTCSTQCDKIQIVFLRGISTFSAL